MISTELSEAEFAALAARRCPNCANRQFRRGPSGGLSVNIACARCGARFNVTAVGGELLLAQRIENFGEWPDRGFWTGGLTP